MLADLCHHGVAQMRRTHETGGVLPHARQDAIRLAQKALGLHKLALCKAQACGLLVKVGLLDGWQLVVARKADVFAQRGFGIVQVVGCQAHLQLACQGVGDLDQGADTGGTFGLAGNLLERHARILLGRTGKLGGLAGVADAVLQQRQAVITPGCRAPQLDLLLGVFETAQQQGNFGICFLRHGTRLGIAILLEQVAHHGAAGKGVFDLPAFGRCLLHQGKAFTKLPFGHQQLSQIALEARLAQGRHGGAQHVLAQGNVTHDAGRIFLVPIKLAQGCGGQRGIDGITQHLFQALDFRRIGLFKFQIFFIRLGLRSTHQQAQQEQHAAPAPTGER